MFTKAIIGSLVSSFAREVFKNALSKKEKPFKVRQKESFFSSMISSIGTEVGMEIFDFIKMIVKSIFKSTRKTPGDLMKDYLRKTGEDPTVIAGKCGVLFFRKRFMKRFLRNEVKISQKLANRLQEATGIPGSKWIPLINRNPESPQTIHSI